MKLLNKDLLGYLFTFLPKKDVYLVLSATKQLDVEHGTRSLLYRQLSFDLLDNHIQKYYVRTGLIDSLRNIKDNTYNGNLEIHNDYINLYNLYLMDLSDSLLEKGNMTIFTSMARLYKKYPPNYRKKIGYSTTFRQPVFIQNNMIVCAVYGCRMMGPVRRTIVHSNTLKALVG